MLTCAQNRMNCWNLSRNQQPSYRYTYRRFRDYLRSKDFLITGIECPTRFKRDDIVQIRRRAALLSLSNLSDQRMRHAKDGAFWNDNPHYSLANISVAYTEKPDMSIFMDEWSALYKSRSGERGIFNRQAIDKYTPERRQKDDWGTNPCLVGRTLLPTKEGLIRLASAVNSKVIIRDGFGSWTEAFVEQTSNASPILEVLLSDGSRYECTPSHDFVLSNGVKCKAIELYSGAKLKPARILEAFGSNNQPNEAYLDAWLIADGTWHNKNGSKLYLYWPKFKYQTALEQVGAIFSDDGQDRKVAYFSEREYLDKSRIPTYILKGNKETVLAFIKGYLEADGHKSETNKGWLVQFASIHREFLEDLQALLLLIGVYSSIGTMKESGKYLLPNGKDGLQEYTCKTVYRLTVSNPLQLFVHLYPELVKRGPYKVTRKVTVVSVTDTGRLEPVYCLGVPTTRSFDLPTVHSGNCSEIILRKMEFCNLSTIVIRPNDNLETLIEKIKLAAMMGTLQATLTNFVYLNPKWKENCEEEALLGVSMTGCMDHPILNGRSGEAELIYWLQRLKIAAVETNISWAKKLGIEPAKAVTCIKPEGTTSQLVDAAPGLHPRYAKYQYRTFRADIKDPLALLMRDAGVPCETDITNKSNFVFTFPKKAPEGAMIAGDQTAIEQLELWLIYQKHFCEHKPSITIYVREHEWMEVGAWVYANFDDLTGVSFLPYSGHVYQQAPEQPCTEEEYLAAVEAMPEIPWHRLSEYELEDNTSETRELACVAGYCETR